MKSLEERVKNVHLKELSQITLCRHKSKTQGHIFKKKKSPKFIDLITEKGNLLTSGFIMVILTLIMENYF
jgi:hypothetical protein